MNGLVKRLKEEHNIDVIATHLESDGYAITGKKLIFVNSSLEETKQIEVVLHELKHILDHAEFVELYKKHPFRSKMETDAEVFMIKNLIAENGGQYNYSQILEVYRVGMGYDECYQRTQ